MYICIYKEIHMHMGLRVTNYKLFIIVPLPYYFFVNFMSEELFLIKSNFMYNYLSFSKFKILLL